MAAGLLMRAQWRVRRGRQLVVGGILAAGLLLLLVASMFLAGAEAGVERPLHDMLSGDVRITLNSTDLAGGGAWADSRPVEEAVRTVPGAVAAPRWEASQVTARRDRFENWTGGLLVGIDPGIPQEQADLRGYLVWGTVLPVESLADPATQHVYVPLLVGESAAKRLGLEPGPGGGPNFDQVLRLTSGRFANGASAPPLDREAVVVGVYRSGLEVLDRFAAFAPIEHVRYLVGGHPGDPSANAVVVHGATVADVQGLGIPHAQAVDGHALARQTMGLVLMSVEVAVGLAMAVLCALLALLLLREVGLQVSRDAPALAALRAIGVPARTTAAGYVGLSVMTVAAAATCAAALDLLVAVAAPPVALEGSGVRFAVVWQLQPDAIAFVALGAVALSGLAAWWAVRRVGRATAAESLRAA